jgi:hypothetical protein
MSCESLFNLVSALIFLFCLWASQRPLEQSRYHFISQNVTQMIATPAKSQLDRSNCHGGPLNKKLDFQKVNEPAERPQYHPMVAEPIKSSWSGLNDHYVCQKAPGTFKY